MADISMCMGGSCPNKDNCYRYTAPVNPYWQSYFCEIPWQDGKECVHYWPVETKEKQDDRHT